MPENAHTFPSQKPTKNPRPTRAAALIAFILATCSQPTLHSDRQTAPADGATLFHLHHPSHHPIRSPLRPPRITHHPARRHTPWPHHPHQPQRQVRPDSHHHPPQHRFLPRRHPRLPPPRHPRRSHRLPHLVHLPRRSPVLPQTPPARNQRLRRPNPLRLPRSPHHP